MDPKLKSLKWAIGELSKQKEELEGKLKVARKRDETSALIEEVHAQKDALEKRIASLQDGLRVSSDLVDDQVEELAQSISTVNEKLEIAQERMEALEQEEYLEELGRKLNGDYSTEVAIESSEEISDETEFSSNTDPFVPSVLPDVSSEASIDLQTSPTPVLMKSPSNRIETEAEETSSSRIPSPEVTDSPWARANSSSAKRPRLQVWRSAPSSWAWNRNIF